MDVFFEQIIEIKKSLKDYLMLAGLWILAIGLSAVILFFLFAAIGPITLLPVIGIIYGAYKLSMFFFVEYEYIITNGSLDIDKIIAKNSRKRIASVELSCVDSLNKFNPSKKIQSGYERVVIACNKEDNNAYEMTVTKEGKGRQYIVFSPNDKIKTAAVKFLPKFIANSAFK